MMTREVDTEKLPTSTRRVAETSYAAYQARKTTHRVAASVPRVQGTPTRVQEAQRVQVQGDEVEISAQDAFNVWSAGNANVRDLAKAMGITVYQATKLYGLMVDEGLIERKAKVTVRRD
jgi:hypothetical protein